MSVRICRRWPQSRAGCLRRLAWPRMEPGNPKRPLIRSAPARFRIGRTRVAERRCGEKRWLVLLCVGRQSETRSQEPVLMTYDGKRYRLELSRGDGRWLCRIDGRDVDVDVVLIRPDVLSLRVGNQVYEV